VTNGQLESQFNFNLFDVAIQVFIDSTQSFEILASEFDRTYHYYGPLHLMGNIMDSHDKIRYMAYADGDLVINQGDANMIAWNNPPKVDNISSYAKAQLYLAYMFTIPGLPVIYYGSEFGMTGASDPDNRRMMRFGKDLNENEKAMMENVKKLVKVRNEASALRYGDLLPVHIEKDLLGYIRSDLNGRYLVVLNKSSKPAEKKIYVPSVYGYTLTDVFTEKRVSVYDPVKLDAYGYRIFRIN
jgi:glycosidase